MKVAQEKRKSDVVKQVYSYVKNDNARIFEKFNLRTNAV
jgi:hypothetical protein